MSKKKGMIFIHSKKRSFFDLFSLSDTLAEIVFFSMVFYLNNYYKIKKDKNFMNKMTELNCDILKE